MAEILFNSIENLTSNDCFNFQKILNSADLDLDPDTDSHTDISPLSNITCNYIDPISYSRTYCNSPNISVWSINIQGLPAKFGDLCDLINLMSDSKCSPDVICLQEIWNFPSYANFQIPGYSFVYKSRSTVRGGGVGIYIRSAHRFVVLDDISVFSDRIFESLFVEISFQSGSKCVVGSVYRPGTQHPSLSQSDQLSNFIEILSNISSSLSDLSCTSYICGDFNLDILDYAKSQKISDYIDLMFSYGFLQVIMRPTRCSSTSATLIDHVFTNSNNTVISSEILTINFTDHFATIVHLPSKKMKQQTNLIKRRVFSKENCDKFRQTLGSISWNSVTSVDESQLSFNIFSDIFLNLFELHFPMQTIKFNKNFNNLEPWFSKAFLVSRRRKFELSKQYNLNPTADNLALYKTYRNLFNKLLRQAKKMHFEKQLILNQSNIKKNLGHHPFCY